VIGPRSTWRTHPRIRGRLNLRTLRGDQAAVTPSDQRWCSYATSRSACLPRSRRATERRGQCVHVPPISALEATSEAAPSRSLVVAPVRGPARTQATTMSGLERLIRTHADTRAETIGCRRPRRRPAACRLRARARSYARPHGVRWITWERVSRGVPEEDALLLAEEVRHQAELSDVARNLARRLPPSTLPDVSLTAVASMTSVRRGV
jgi:hypothetical protein